MEYRVGTCNKCGKQWKLPASFSGDRAKPKEEDCLKLPEEACDGVVDVGPVVNDSPDTAAEAEPVIEEVPVKPKKREGPSMKERLLAERRAAEEAAAAKPVPAKKPTAAKKPAEAKDAAKPAAKPAAKTPAGRKAGAGSARRGAAAKKGAPSEGRASARRSGGAEGGGRSSRRRPAPEKKKSPAPIIGVVVLLLVAVAAWQFLGGEADAPDQTMAASNPAEAPVETPEPVDPDPEPIEAPADLADETAGTEDAGAEGGEGAPAAAAKPAVDLSSVDLDALEVFGPDRDTDDAEWTKIQELVDTTVDPMAGAAGNRAKKKIVDHGRKAMPAIINKLKTFDLTTEQGFRDGDLLQRTMMDICNGRNVGWKYSTEPADALFNKKAVRLWHDLWSRARTDDAYWANMAKIEQKDAPADEPEVNEEDLEDLGDLLGGG